MSWTIELRKDDGELKATIKSFNRLSVSRRLSERGWVEIELPLESQEIGGTPISSNLEVDDLLYIWNHSGEYPTGTLDSVCFVRKWQILTSESGKSSLIISGPDQNELVFRRIVAYYSGATQSKLADYEGNIMYYLIYYNMWDGVPVGDEVRQMPSSFDVQVRLDQGAETERSFAWANVGDSLNKLQESSRANGEEVFWSVQVVGLEDTGLPKLAFTTFTGAPGGDNSWSLDSPTNGLPMIFGPEFGNVEGPSIVYDYTSEVNKVYCGGPGEGSERAIIEVGDTTRQQKSLWNYREGFADARNEKTLEGLYSKAYAVLNEGRPKIYFSGRIISTERTPYGGWTLGSKITITYAGKTFSTLVRNLQIEIDSEGKERIFSNMELEGSL